MSKIKKMVKKNKDYTRKYHNKLYGKGYRNLNILCSPYTIKRFGKVRKLFKSNSNHRTLIDLLDVGEMFLNELYEVESNG